MDADTLMSPAVAAGQTKASRARVGETQHYRYYDLIMAGFVTVLLCSNLIGAGKVCHLFGLTFGAGVLFFPISYIFGDVLTEVYGYARARKVVWAGFAAMIFATVMAVAIVWLPPAEGWTHQPEYALVFGQTPRIVIGSLLGFWAGEFANSFTLAKLKILTNGRFLWVRTIGSTVIGEAVDSFIFFPVAFWGDWSPKLMITVIISNYAIKVLWEAALTPVTYQVVNFLKRSENEDFFDRETNFTPFSLQT
jgi:uncharacterized integral membrane protein (TIGR00697 family)